MSLREVPSAACKRSLKGNQLNQLVLLTTPAAVEPLYIQVSPITFGNLKMLAS